LAGVRDAYVSLAELPIEEQFGPFYTASDLESSWRLRITNPKWLVGTVVGLLALLVVVAPVLGRGTAGAKKPRWALSGFSTAPLPFEAPVIDATTEGAPVVEPLAPIEAEASQPYSVIGPPSLSVGQIEAVLRQYGSPAVGKGQHLYDLGIRYSIDPAYALAFFVHESACGTKGVARFTQSLGNIRWTEGFESYEGYRKYPSWEAGMEDWYKLITELYIGGWNLRTVDQIIPVYAPSGDNNHPPTYIASVKAMVDSWRGK
jgi:hypothetical protein